MRWLWLLLLVIPVNRLTSEFRDDFNYADFKCLVENAYQEARGEGIKGMQAVTHVVMSRMESSGHSACQVVQEPKQFSWYNRHKLNPRRGLVWATRGSRLDASRATYAMLFDPDYQGHPALNGAKWYHEKSVRPVWSLKLRRIVQIGNHIFYK